MMRRIILLLVTFLAGVASASQPTLRLPFAQGQWWQPTTYEGHDPGGTRGCIDFNKVTESSVRSTWPFGNQTADEGEEVRASFSGKITVRTYNVDSKGYGYGNYIKIQSNEDGAYVSTYAHMSSFNPKFALNSTVQAGEVIGYVGHTGTGGSHLHFELRYNGSYQNIDNMVFDGQAVIIDYTRQNSVPQYVGHPIQARSAIPSTISWTSTPEPNRWYRSDEHLDYAVSGSRPNDVQEIVDNAIRNTYHDISGGYLPLSYIGQGWHKYEARTQNSANGGSWHYTTAWYGGYDVTPPTVSQTGGPAPNTWVRSAGQAVQYTGADAHSGFKDSHWWFEGQGDSGWSGENPRGCPLPSSDGKYRLHVESADQAWTGSILFGNSSDVVLGEFWIDNTPPTVAFGAITPPSPGDPTQVTIKVDASDPNGENGSGIKVLVVAVDGSEFTGVDGTFTWDASTATEGAHTLVARATDWAGNTASATRTYVIDRKPPSVTLTLGPVAPNGQNGWYTVAPTVTLTTQSATGTAVSHYRVNGGAEQTYTGPFALAARGVVTVEAWAVSASGRKGEAQTATVRIDTTAPAGFALEDEGDATPSLGALNVSLRGLIDGESGYDGIEYKVGDAADDDRYRIASFVPARGPWLAIDGLFLPPSVPVVVKLRVRNGAGLWSVWMPTDGITVDETAWDHAVWNAVLGAAGGFSSAADGTGLHQGTLGEIVLGVSAASDGLLDAGFWSLFTKPKVTADLALSNYGAASPAVPVTVELRLPGTTTVVERHAVMATATGSLTLALGRTGTYDVAVRGGHWLRKVVKSVKVTATGASLGAISLVNGDVNGDNIVSAADLAKVKVALGTALGDPSFNPNADLNGDGIVNAADLAIVKIRLGSIGDD